MLTEQNATRMEGNDDLPFVENDSIIFEISGIDPDELLTVVGKMFTRKNYKKFLGISSTIIAAGWKEDIIAGNTVFRTDILDKSDYSVFATVSIFPKQYITVIGFSKKYQQVIVANIKKDEQQIIVSTAKSIMDQAKKKDFDIGKIKISKSMPIIEEVKKMALMI